MSNPYFNSEGYADPTAYEGIKNASNRWLMSGYEKGKRLTDYLVMAKSFDEAIEKARKKNPNYSAGQRCE